MFGQGRLCAVTDDSGSTVYGYDRRGQVISEAHAVKGNSYLPLQYGYDAAGGRTKGVYPTGDVITTTYDLGGRPLSMTVTPPGGSATPLVTAITHKPFGPISGFTTAAGVVETRTFDTRYRRQSQTTVGAAGASNPLVSLSYTNYDKEGNLLQLDDLSLSPAVSQLFSYDPDRYFLVGATGPYLPGLATKQFQWGYDANGNRLFETASPGETRSFGYESWYDEYGVLRHSGVLTNISTAPDGNTVLESDFGGNLIGEGLVVGKRYSYDALARLKQVTSVSGIRPRHRESVVAFEHDATGHRVHAALTVGGFGPVVIQTLEDCQRRSNSGPL